MKKLEDMNLVDDFLAYSLTAHKTYGEKAARYILECILQRKIRHLTVMPQKSWYGERPKTHGVRLDVYLDEEDGELFDMEPDNSKEADDMAALPRRVRFYHSKIDAGNLASGEDYSALRNVIVIFITTYDPFGWKRMIYTVKNCCIEEPELPYEDGARTIFLYTKGTAGEPPEELRELARYMEHSTAANARSAGLRQLHEMVMEVKTDREVGLAYMNTVEIENRIKKRARAEGLAEGRIEGRAEGRIEGHAEGRIEGHAEAVLTLLSAKGSVPPSVESTVLAQTDRKALDHWLLLAAAAESVEAFQEKSGLS